MKIIIDIPKEKYEVIKMRYYTFPAEMKEWGLEAIRNGVLVKSVTGDIIDERRVESEG